MRQVPSWCPAFSGRGTCRGYVDAVLPKLRLIEAFPWRDTGTGKGGTEAGGRQGPGPVTASVQVAHTKRTSSLVWRHMIKIFSPLPLPEAIYCFSAAWPLGQRARRSSRPAGCPGPHRCGRQVWAACLCPAAARDAAALSCLRKRVFSAFTSKAQRCVEYF